jgi:hypothetical protein
MHSDETYNHRNQKSQPLSDAQQKQVKGNAEKNFQRRLERHRNGIKFNPNNVQLTRSRERSIYYYTKE